jgi:hypothetical protein
VPNQSILDALSGKGLGKTLAQSRTHRQLFDGAFCLTRQASSYFFLSFFFAAFLSFPLAFLAIVFSFL